MHTHGPPDPYEAKLENDSLECLVIETLKLLEHRFAAFDTDGAKSISFDELTRGLTVGKFAGVDELKHYFRQVDLDDSGALEFSELQRVMIKYDTDGSHRLSRDELDNLFKDAFPKYVESGLYQKTLAELFPDPSPGSTVQGTYMMGAATFGVGPASTTWQHLVAGFEVLEADFQRIDENKSGVLVFDELVSEISVNGPSSARVDFVSRLQGAFKLVDEDDSKCLDFYEFALLGYHMSIEGSYHSLISKCTNPSAIKKAFLAIYTLVKKDRKAVTYDELLKLSVSAFGEVPAKLQAAFHAVTAGAPSADLLKLLKVFYRLVREGGAYDPTTYVPIRREVTATNISQPEAPVTSHPPRISQVIVAKFKPTKVLGEGGQGKVCLGMYDNSIRCAGKTWLSAPDQELVNEVLNELEFFEKLDHPNCHYLLGSKTSLNDGGIIVLTEVCDKGSLFDLYYKHHTVIDRPTSWRFGKECALGLGHIHSMGYMHRDIKSLNVFLTANFVCQVADFGMCTKETTSIDFCGTGQWMSPEVGLHGLRDDAPPYGKMCDVFSYGILLWEIFHSALPYADTRMDQMAIIKAVCDPNKKFRPTINGSKCPQQVVAILEKCWAYRPDQRITFDKVVAELDAIKSVCH